VAKLISIADLDDFPKRLLKLCSVQDRIESFLEDINTDPALLRAELEMGSLGRRTNIFHASSIGNQSGKSLCDKYPMGCGRELYYSLIGAESEGAWEPRVRRILDTGTAIHGQVQAYLEEIARRSDGEFEYTPEVDCAPDTNEVADMMDISGHTDGDCRVILSKDEVRFLLEIKSINDAGYAKTSGPHPEHKVQGTIYQKCMDVPVIVFLYYNKNDSSLAEFVHVFDHRIWEAIETKLNYVRDHAIAGTLPDQEPSFQCQRCKYKKVCDPPTKRKRASKAAARLFRKGGA